LCCKWGANPELPAKKSWQASDVIRKPGGTGRWCLQGYNIGRRLISK
jgi:hypothetical protein